MSLENMMEPTGELSSDQISAIKHSIEIGKQLVNDHPEIAELYRDGMTHSGIAARLDVKREYDISSDKVAVTSIYHAITGHAGGFGTESYDGLISDLDELAGLEYEHYAKNGRKAAELGLGIHGRNPETGERYVVESGKKAAELGLGIHSLQTSWSKEETEYAHLLSLEPEFQHQKGSWKGKGDYKTIAQVLNKEYHNGEDVRNADAVRLNLFTYRKTLGN
jgi:hypothetical protein